jgi:hypothetical protein
MGSVCSRTIHHDCPDNLKLNALDTRLVALNRPKFHPWAEPGAIQSPSTTSTTWTPPQNTSSSP